MGQIHPDYPDNLEQLIRTEFTTVNMEIAAKMASNGTVNLKKFHCPMCGVSVTNGEHSICTTCFTILWAEAGCRVILK